MKQFSELDDTLRHKNMLYRPAISYIGFLCYILLLLNLAAGWLSLLHY